MIQGDGGHGAKIKSLYFPFDRDFGKINTRLHRHSQFNSHGIILSLSLSLSLLCSSLSDAYTTFLISMLRKAKLCKPKSEKKHSPRFIL